MDILTQRQSKLKLWVVATVIYYEIIYDRF